MFFSRSTASHVCEEDMMKDHIISIHLYVYKCPILLNIEMFNVCAYFEHKLLDSSTQYA